MFNSSKDAPYRCLSLEFSGDKLSLGSGPFQRDAFRIKPAIGGPCADARCRFCQPLMSTTRHLPSVSSVGGSGRGEAAETDEEERWDSEVKKHHQLSNYCLLISKAVHDRGRCRFPSCAMWLMVKRMEGGMERGK